MNTKNRRHKDVSPSRKILGTTCAAGSSLRELDSESPVQIDSIPVARMASGPKSPLELGSVAIHEAPSQRNRASELE